MYKKANEGLHKCDFYVDEQKKNTDIILKGSKVRMKVYHGTLMNDIRHLKRECSMWVIATTDRRTFSTRFRKNNINEKAKGSFGNCSNHELKPLFFT